METLKNGKERLFYVDWLRVFAFGILFIFHAARFFDDYPWHLKNVEHSNLVNMIVGFLHGWRMHLIFFISGIGTFFAMRSRKGEFIKDRFKRLIIPYIFGVITLIPPQKFYEAISNGWFEGSVFEFITKYPVTLFSRKIGISLSWTGHIGYHIWYLAFLFVMTLAFLPLLKILTKKNIISKFVLAVSNMKYGIFLFILPIILINMLLRPFFPGYLNWADFFSYGMYFLIGYIFMTHRTFVQSARNFLYYFLGSAILTSAIGMYFAKNPPQSKENMAFLIIGLIITSISSFSWVMFFFGLSQKILNFNNKYLQNLNIGILPFYILHQTVIIVVGYYIIALNLSILIKFLIILISSFFITIFIYMIIKNFNILRILFGMKKKKTYKIKNSIESNRLLIIDQK